MKEVTGKPCDDIKLETEGTDDKKAGKIQEKICSITIAILLSFLLICNSWAVTIQLRRNLSANWKSVDPILAEGEIGVEADTLKVKVGNGVLAWSDLPYINGDVTPENFGAVADGVTDCTAAINAAIAASSGIVKFGVGTYVHTGTINVNKDRVSLIGQGPQASILSYKPKGAGTAIKFYKTGSAMVQNLFKGFGLQSSNAYDFTKVAIETRNVEDLKIEDVAIYPWNGNRASIGFKSQGKHLVSLSNTSIRADIPISIEQNPDFRAIDIDHYNFHNTYLIADEGPCVQVADGVNLTNVTFDGYQAWVPKTYGFYWHDTTSALASFNLSFKNVRIEQEANAAAYLFYIKHNANIYNVIFENIFGGLTAKGFYFRKVLWPTLNNVFYYNISKNEALNVDSTVYPLTLNNCFWEGGTTAMMTDQVLVFSPSRLHVSGTLPSSAFYLTTATASAPSMGIPNTYVNNAAAIAANLTAGMLYKTPAGQVMIVY